MKCDSEFNILSELLANDEAKKFISTNSIVNLPMNTPPDVASQIIAEIVRKNATISRLDPIGIQTLLASIESSRLSYSLTDKYIIYYFRNADMSLNINPIQCPRLWECVDISRNSL
jgi:hypothetical protein